MTGSPRPPALAVRLLAWRLAQPERDYVLGDLEERFDDHARERSRAGARLWYWRQTLLVLVSPSIPGGGMLTGGLLGDVRFALRSMRRRAVSSWIAVAALAIGVGLAGSAFSILDGTVLRGLPFEASERLVHFERSRPSEGDFSLAVTPHDWSDWRDQQGSFEDLGAYVEALALLPGENEPPSRHWGVFLSANALDLLRVRPALGRAFDEADERVGAPAVVLLSHRLWTQRYAGDPQIVGSDIVMNGEPVTVIGVMPAGFGFPIAEEFWRPLRIDFASVERGSGRLDVFGRLRDGVALETARLEFESIGHRLAEAYPATNADIEPVLRSFIDEYVGEDFARTVWGMLAGATLVLLICCANVANVLLGHTWRRRHDLAVRTALGASRLRLVRSLLIEAILLSGAGALAGLLIASVGVRWFNVAGAQAGAFALPHGSDSLFWWDVRLSGRTMVFVAGLAVLSALLAGLAPALNAARSGTQSVFRSESGASHGRRFSRFSRALVVTELMLATGLLIAAGFVVESVVNIARERETIDGAGIHVATVSLPLSALGVSEAMYPDHASHVRLADRLLASFSADPDISSAAFGTTLPLTTPRSVPFVTDRTEMLTGDDSPSAAITIVSPGWFGLFGVDVLAGRDFGPGDDAGSAPVAIVTRSFTSLHLEGRDAVGARIRLGGEDSAEPWLTVVGVVPDLWSDRLRPFRQAGVYVPLAQSGIGDAGVRLSRFGLRSQSIAVRERGAGADPARRMRSAVYAEDPDLPVTVTRFDDVVAAARGRYRVWARFYFAFAATALLLAALGVYGVLSFSVAARTAEIGIRRAIGATTASVRRTVLRDAFIQVVTGMAAGLFLGAWLAAGLARIVYQVDTAQPHVYVVVIAVLVCTGLLAGSLPAHRAASVDPVTAMRNR